MLILNVYFFLNIIVVTFSQNNFNISRNETELDYKMINFLFNVSFNMDETAPINNKDVEAYCSKNYGSNKALCIENLKKYCLALAFSNNGRNASNLCKNSQTTSNSKAPPTLNDKESPSANQKNNNKAQKAPKYLLNDLANKINEQQKFKTMADVMPLSDTLLNRFSLDTNLVKKGRYRKNELDVNQPDDYFHGDMDLTVKQVKFIESNLVARKKISNNQLLSRRKKRKVGKSPGFHLWSSFPIAYSFNEAVPMKMRIIIEQAIQIWQNNTCVRWQKDGPSEDRIEFVNGDGCSSFVGKVEGTQEISLRYPGCDRVGVAAHEIGHSLGFFHEQSRPDQKQNVAINYPNIILSRYNNFAIMDWKDVNSYQLPYDFGSVMHYDGLTRGFTLDSQKYAIITLDPAYQDTIGQRIGPSFIDFKQINMAYCANKCSTKIGCRNNGYENPNDCNNCKCPTGLSGRLCESVESSSPGCRGSLKLTSLDDSSAPKFLSSPNYPNNFPLYQKCTWLLEAPTNAKISLEFASDGVFDFPCDLPCAETYVEIKADGDFQRVGPRFCCNRLPKNRTFLSHGQKMLVIFRSASDVGKGFKANYHIVNGPSSTKSTPTRATTLPIATPTTMKSKTEILTTPYSVQTTTTTFKRPLTTTDTEQPDSHVSEPTNAPGCDCQDWSDWSSCSQECGGCGTKYRQRSCTRSNCFSKEIRHCNFEKCPPDMTILATGGELKFLFYGCCFGLVSNNAGQCTGLANAFREYIKTLQQHSNG